MPHMVPPIDPRSAAKAGITFRDHPLVFSVTPAIHDLILMRSVLPPRVRRFSTVAAFAAAMASLVAWRAPFHLHLLKSTPGANATIAAAPDSIRLWFSQAPELKLTTVQVTGPGNAAVPLTALASRDAAGVVAGVKGTMPSGAYVVTWRTMARDGHIARGSFTFAIAAGRR